MYLLYPGTLASMFNILTLAKVGQNLRMQAASPMPDVSDPHYPFFFQRRFIFLVAPDCMTSNGICQRTRSHFL